MERLSVTQKRGIISLIPKDESNLTVFSNWRPIALLNVDYKILAKAIAKRIQPKLPKLIYTDQTGFIKGRFIGQNVRLLIDLMEYTDVKKIPGILLFVDFEKAFETVQWSFIQNVLKRFNFGPVIRHWISTLYSDVESAVINGGYTTNFFQTTFCVRCRNPCSKNKTVTWMSWYRVTTIGGSENKSICRRHNPHLQGYRRAKRKHESFK